MNCMICGKPITLFPSAAERAAKTGEPTAYYTRLFTSHSDCFLEKRKRETSELMRRIREAPPRWTTLGPLLVPCPK